MKELSTESVYQHNRVEFIPSGSSSGIYSEMKAVIKLAWVWYQNMASGDTFDSV